MKTGDDMGLLELEGMEFYACHGCLESEKKTGNLFIVDFRAWVDMAGAIQSDALEDAIDYGEIYMTIKKEMQIHSDLLEHLAGRIVHAIERNFPGLSSFSIRVSKRRPPVNGIAAWSRVTLYHGDKNMEGKA